MKAEGGSETCPSSSSSSSSSNRVEVAAAVITRLTAASCWASGRREGLCGLLGVSRRESRDEASQRPALRRELHEELGIDVEQAYPWVTRDYDYAHAAVQLRFSRSRMVGHAARPGKPAVRMAAPRRGGSRSHATRQRPYPQGADLAGGLRHQQCSGCRRTRVFAAARARAGGGPRSAAGAGEATAAGQTGRLDGKGD